MVIAITGNLANATEVMKSSLPRYETTLRCPAVPPTRVYYHARWTFPVSILVRSNALPAIRQERAPGRLAGRFAAPDEA
jgi:hypothetical protein